MFVYLIVNNMFFPKKIALNLLSSQKITFAC